MGDVGVGGANPLRLQSMTTTNTLDVAATTEQAERLAAAGCEIVRITAPGLREARALGEIAAALRRRGVRVPLVADIHFTPNAALEAALYVEKVRINPGNYADRKRFEVREYSDAQYAEELERVAQRFRPLLRRCRELGRALRIGANHGSLSDRILNRFGDTPRGMVESALEFLDVCEDEGFRDVIFSMKSSNAQVAIRAYRLLVARLAERAGGLHAPSYPLHLGVTEAGDGEDGRIKSAIGIGALLEDGIGDTLRVSLTEDPLREIPVARALANHYDGRACAPRAAAAPLRAAAVPGDEPPLAPAAGLRVVTAGASSAAPADFARRPSRAVGDVGGGQPVRVEAWLGAPPPDADAAAREVAAQLGELAREGLRCEGLGVSVRSEAEARRAAAFGSALARQEIALPLSAWAPPHCAEAAAQAAARVILLPAAPEAAADVAAASAESAAATTAVAGEADGGAAGEFGGAAIFGVAGPELVPAARRLAARLQSAAPPPLALRFAAARHSPRFAAAQPADAESDLLRAAAQLGALLCDGIGDLVSLGGFGSLARDVSLAYRILQGARLRTSWTEFISCPSCGRTLFDLEETTARVKAATGHLAGLKIAVMGCIVNGPGEMADADFGYVGSGAGLVDLYAGRARLVRNVPAAEAPARLVELIRQHGRWRDP